MSTLPPPNEVVDKPAPEAPATSPSLVLKKFPMSLGQAWDLLMADMRRKRAGFASRPEDMNFFKRYVKLNLELGSIAVTIFRYGQWATRLNNPLLRFVFGGIYWLLNMGIMVAGGINLQANSNIGRGFVIHNFSGTFIWSDCIGESFTVNQGVTVGNVRGSGGLPQIGNNVYLGAGCKVLGKLKIGDNVVVGANSVVISDVPDNATVMGVPARIVARNASSEYLKF